VVAGQGLGVGLGEAAADVQAINMGQDLVLKRVDLHQTGASGRQGF